MAGLLELIWGLLELIGCLSALVCCLLLENLKLEVGKIISPHNFDSILVCVKNDSCDIPLLVSTNNCDCVLNY